jgi:hypothetical protein
MQSRPYQCVCTSFATCHAQSLRFESLGGEANVGAYRTFAAPIQSQAAAFAQLSEASAFCVTNKIKFIFWTLSGNRPQMRQAPVKS